VLDDLEKAGIDDATISDLPLGTMTPPWKLIPPGVDLTLTKYKKDTTPPAIFQSAFLEQASNFPSYSHIYTDGSKNEEKVGCAAVAGRSFRTVLKERLPDHSSIYTAELKGLLLSLTICGESEGDKFLVISDSLSALQGISSLKLTHPLLADFHDAHTELREKGIDILFMWCPSHVGVRGNAAADAAAKESLQHPEPDTRLYVPYTDLKTLVNKYVFKLWQQDWSQQGDNKLFQVMPDLADAPPLSASGRRAQSKLNRLLIGHTYFTHGFLLRNEDPPWCHACDELNSVKHILTSCADLIEAREQHFQELRSLKEIFNQSSLDSIFGFLQTIGIFNRV